MVVAGLKEVQNDIDIVGLDGILGDFTDSFLAAAQTTVYDLVTLLRIVEYSDRGHHTPADFGAVAGEEIDVFGIQAEGAVITVTAVRQW